MPTPSVSPAPSPAERSLAQASQSLTIQAAAKRRVFNQIQQRIQVSPVSLLQEAREALTPTKVEQRTIWARVQEAMSEVSKASFWSKVRSHFLPANELRDMLWARIEERLEPVPTSMFSRPIKLVAAFCLLVLAIRVSPFLLLAPQTLADSPVTAMRTRGDAGILIGGLWQPIQEDLRLEKPSQLSTGEGELTLVLHDDAVIRLAPHTTITLNDLSDRPEKEHRDPTLILEQGQIWVLGLVPKPIRGISIATNEGQVMVQEGSISLTQDQGSVLLRVWDRTAKIMRRGISMSVLAGEEIELRRNEYPQPHKMQSSLYHEEWTERQLSRDAAHRREIAQLQQERRASSAGILPDSSLYPVKRLAEAVDVLFTVGSEARTRKRIQHANTRLSEAAALIKQGSGAQVVNQMLEEYKTTVLAVASGAVLGDEIVDSILEQEVVAEATAGTAAALPDDESYVLKVAVRDTIAALPASVEKPDTTTAAVLDEIALAKRQAGEGEISEAKVNLDEARNSVLALTGSAATLTLEAQQEVEATIAVAQSTVEEVSDILPEPSDVPLKVSRTAPPLRPSVPEYRPLTDEEIEQKAQEIRGRIYVFELKKSQLNELREQIRSLERNPDRGRILRRLYKILPSNGLAQYVRRQITDLDLQNRALQEDSIEQESGSGSCLECTE